MTPVLVVHYDEIGIKGRNRSLFEHQLKLALKAALKGLGPAEVHRFPGRFLVFPRGDAPLPGLQKRLAALPGVRYVLGGLQTGVGIEEIEEATLALLPGEGIASFGVRVRRPDKSHPLRSSQIEARLGELVGVKKGWRVDLTHPDLWLRVELPGGVALVTSSREEGSGGLPTGASGNGVALLSGGIDSPVAAHMMMTRGLRLSLVHFHSAPYTSRASQRKVRDLALLLTRAQPVLDLTLVPFADPIQQAIVKHTPPALRVLLYRRFMLRLALKAATERGASSLITGEALGQVASQTIENLAAVEAVSPLPVLRPLIGMGKSAIIDRARQLGTYSTSIQPHDDCCTYLMPDRPATRSSAEELEEAEQSLAVLALVEAAWDQRSAERLLLSESEQAWVPSPFKP